jgi:hypothetical protein
MRSRAVSLTSRFQSRQPSFLSGRHHCPKLLNAVNDLGKSGGLQYRATASCYEISASETDNGIDLLLQESATIDEEMAPVCYYHTSRSITYLDEPLALVIIPAGLNHLTAKLDELL